jgi:hypothetical protein
MGDPPAADRPARRMGTDMARFMFDQWVDSPVVLRVDTEFAGALMNSNTDVELVPDWLARFPFNAIAYSLATPLSLHDGHRMCHYVGMLVVGTISEFRAGVTPPNQPGGIRFTDSSGRGFFTRYLKIPEAQGVRCLWVYQEAMPPRLTIESTTVSRYSRQSQSAVIRILVRPGPLVSTFGSWAYLSTMSWPP